MTENAPSSQSVQEDPDAATPVRPLPTPRESTPAGGGAVPERPFRAAARTSGRLARVPDITSVALTLAAGYAVVTALSIGARHALEPVVGPLDLLLPISLPTSLSAAALFAVLAAAAERRKRVGWWAIVAVASLHVLSSVVVTLALWFAPAEVVPSGELGQAPPAGAVTAAVLVQVALFAAFLAARRHFPTRVRRRALVRALVVLVLAILAGIVIGFGVVSLLPGTLTSLGERAAWVASTVTGSDAASDIPGIGHPSRPAELVVGFLGLVALLLPVLVLVRSQRAASVLTPEAERRLRRLLATYGDRDSLGYFATRRDKAAIFSPSGKAALTYRVVAGVSLASADPIGDPDHWGPAVDRWIGEARTYAWIPAVMGASEAGAVAYRRAGLKVLEIGDEAVVHVARFDLDQPELRPVRQVVQRLKRAGYAVRVRRHGALSRQEMDELLGLADSWRHGETERGFSMALSRLGDPADADCVAVEALDPDGSTVALLSFVPWGSRGLSLDLMRRDRDAVNGLTELMISELAIRGPALGVDRLSLNFAVFRSAFEDGARIGAGPVARGWRRLLLVASRWWQLESLYRANAKYQPEWVPRFLCYSERRELVKISLASAIAEGFLTLPGTSPSLGPAGTPPDGGPIGGQDEEASHSAASGADDHRPVQDPDGDRVEAALAAHVAALPEQVRGRLATRDRLRAGGVDPYPVTYPRTTTVGEVAARHGGLPAGGTTGEAVALTGRVVAVRDHGRACFVVIRDWSGDLQVLLDCGRLGQAALARFTRDVDLGDHIGVTGEVVASRRGELSVAADSWALTAKCLRPLPDKHRGLVDPEARVRQRYLDLVLRPDAREVLTVRSRVVGALRTSLASRGFLEVETPQLQPVHGGAAARPFTTHMAALDLTVYLRIAPELYLKRLCVGGMERVFEIGRTFRNEGLSSKHNPEFTMLEAYLAYADYRDMLDLTRSLIVEAATAAYGEPVARRRQDDGSTLEVDLSGPWPVLTVAEAISRATGEEITADTGHGELVRLCDRVRVQVDPAWGRGAVVLELYERLVEHETREPAFYLDFPTDVSPLTRPHRDDDRLAERWDLVAFGTEVATAYSELVDPVEQRRRLTRQSILAAGGDPEAMQLDEDFLTALEYGMPPTGGMGMGVDRLVMMLTGRSIRETVAFPTARPR
jgi:lysyl-tRNA synthetase, class II